MGGFLGGLLKAIPGVGNVIGTGMEILGGLSKLGKNKPQKMQSQLTPEQQRLLAARYKYLQQKAADPTSLNYVRTAGNATNQALFG
ncbi:MAG: hypothetical protein MZV70_54345 [Desulfobacterales bacterium]|nr:hypothetical protein [Desulfobacterales bacterium]